MLRKVRFQNFMSLRDVSIDLEPLTVFIGPNGAGKSAIFKALVTVGRLIGGAPVRGRKGEFQLEPGVGFDEMVWGGDAGLPIIFSLWLDTDDDEPGYTLELRKRAEGWSVVRERIRTAANDWIEVAANHPFEHATEHGQPEVYSPPLPAPLRYLVYRFSGDPAALPSIKPILELRERFGRTLRYRPGASNIASFVSRPIEPGKTIHVGSDGWGLAAALQDIQGNDRKTFEAIEGDLHKLFPYIRTINFDSDWQGVRLSFGTDRNQNAVNAPLESDGALLATFLLWRLHTAGSSIITCLEEPEYGLHPELLAPRYELLRRFATAKEDPVQILVATHSLELLRVMHTHHSVLFKEVRMVKFIPNTGSRVGKPGSFKEMGKLLERYLSGMESGTGVETTRP